MARLTLRYNVLILLVMTLLLCVILLLAPLLPIQIGTVNFGILDDGEFRTYIADMDTGVMDYRRFEPSIPSLEQLIVIGNSDEEQSVVQHVGEEEIVLATYEGIALHRESAFWLERDKTLFVLGRSVNPPQTTLFSVDIERNTWTELVNIEDFQTGDYRFSPNRQYILLRRVSEGNAANPIRNAQPLLLVHLETGQIKELGNTNFAYWSLQSEAIVLGYPVEQSFTSRLSIYNVVQDKMQDFELTIAQVDTPVFNNGDENAILWRNDGQALVATNRDRDELYYLSLEGDIVVTVIGSILPRRWSPDGRYLLSFGSDLEGQVGAFIIDPINGETHFVGSPILLLGSYTTEAWSLNSQYIALSPRRAGMNNHTVAVFNLYGEMIADALEVKNTGDNFMLYGTLEWTH